MKSYDRFVVWLDYLDSERKRHEGRRVPLNSCVKAPTLEELTQACRQLKLEPEGQVARFPKATFRQSGYASVNKGGHKKQQALLLIAREIGSIRGSKKPGQTASQSRKV